MTPRKNILIYRLGSLGDTIIALPCFYKIRESFPDAKITLLTNRPIMSNAAPIEEVLGKSYFFDTILNYPVGTRNPFLLGSIIKQIRSNKIDTVVNLTAARSKFSAVRDKWFFRFAGIKHFIGFPHKKEDFNVLIDSATGMYEWEAKRLARRINVLGPVLLENEQSWDIKLINEEIKEADRLLGTIIDIPFIAVSTGTKCQSKDWEIYNWMNLLKDLGKALPGYKLVILGAHEEKYSADRCLQAWNAGGLNLCGQTSPRVSAAVLKKAALFVGHDSGPMHLAAAVGTHCIAIFSARSFKGQWFPRGKNHSILYHQTDCAGCGLEICIAQKKKCILSISVEEVKRVVFNALVQVKKSDFSYPLS